MITERDTERRKSYVYILGWRQSPLTMPTKRYNRVYLIHDDSQTNEHVHSSETCRIHLGTKELYITAQALLLPATHLASFIRDPTAASSQHSRFRFRSPQGHGQHQPLVSRFSAPLPLLGIKRFSTSIRVILTSHCRESRPF